MLNSENNKRIAKNTLLLYFRMILTMLISLYTVRVVLKTLGVVDYGIYNVVGGVVVMFSFLSRTMSSASQRFFAFEIGNKNIGQLKKIFSLTITIYIGISLLVLILSETIGLWFLNAKMNIPAERMEAANWIYQFSIFSFIMTIMTVPYNASIIAHENMKVFAYVSIFEVFMKLAIVYFLLLFSVDKLKLYAVLMFFATTIVTLVYRTICYRKYDECRYKFIWDKNLFQKLMSYSGWNLFGTVASILNNSGLNILLNIFFGPVVNAARAVAFQVNSVINQFVTNFITAVNPQITKYYANNERENMIKLVFQSSKLAYFLLFILSMPVLLETHFILALWLKQVPEYTVLFVRLVILTAMIDSISYPLMTSAQATGKIKRYQTIVGSVLMLNLPISYFFLRFGAPPETTMYVSMVISMLCLFLRVWILKGMIDFPVSAFVKKILYVLIAVSVLSYLLPLTIVMTLDESFWRFAIVALVSPLVSLSLIFLIGINSAERNFLITSVKSKILRK